VHKQIAQEKDITPDVQAIFEILMMLISLLLGRSTTNSLNNSTNSSTPPSQNQNRLKPTRQKSNRPIGGVIPFIKTNNTKNERIIVCFKGLKKSRILIAFKPFKTDNNSCF